MSKNKINQEAINALYDCIQTRPRPEDVAEIVLDILEASLGDEQKAIIIKAAKHSFKRAFSYFSYSSMPSDFIRPESAEKQVNKARELFLYDQELTAADCLKPEVVKDFLQKIAPQIGYQIGKKHFVGDRLNRHERKSAGLDYSKRQYNKRWRLLKRIETKIYNMEKAYGKYDFSRIGKSALAIKLSKEQLAKDIPSACFIAYYSSRMSLRSAFTNSSQVRAYDKVSDMLFKNAAGSKDVNWFAIAHVHSEQNVLLHLSDKEKGELLGVWFGILEDIADEFLRLSKQSNLNLKTMVVKRGNDSSSWNETANAWNQARANWIALLYSMELESILDEMCPGKVLKLMAGDVAEWHKSDRRGLHPDTRVWAKLPMPWQVLKGKEKCTRSYIVKICEEENVHPWGWVTPKPQKVPVSFTPTPELVHGVAVSSPAFAKVLKKAKWYSGKKST